MADSIYPNVWYPCTLKPGRVHNHRCYCDPITGRRYGGPTREM